MPAAWDAHHREQVCKQHTTPFYTTIKGPVVFVHVPVHDRGIGGRHVLLNFPFFQTGSFSSHSHPWAAGPNDPSSLGVTPSKKVIGSRLRLAYVGAGSRHQNAAVLSPGSPLYPYSNLAPRGDHTANHTAGPARPWTATPPAQPGRGRPPQRRHSLFNDELYLGLVPEYLLQPWNAKCGRSPEGHPLG